MNIAEALKHLQEGKKIQTTETIEPYIYQLFDSFLGMYFLEKNKKSFILVEIEEFSITNNNWIVFSNPIPITFFSENFDSAGGGHSIGASEFYEKGYTIKRLKTGEIFNNTNLSDKKFSIEDINANDWEILEKSR
jgi:hypothetical protein